jgi:hypothetical protein
MQPANPDIEAHRTATQRLAVLSGLLLLFLIIANAIYPYGERWLSFRRIIAAVDREPHQCVPLGWAPQPVANTFVVGESVYLDTQSWYLSPLWVGLMPTKPRSRSLKRIGSILDDLTSRGLLTKVVGNGEALYDLSSRGFRYYYQDDFADSNPERESYLCFSYVVVNRWKKIGGSTGTSYTIWWEPTELASWARSDSLVLSHSVVLAPTTNPFVIELSNFGNDLSINGVTKAGENKLAEPSVWR